MVPKVAGIGALSVAGVAGACGGAYLLMREKTISDRVSKSGFTLIKYGDSDAWKLAAKHLKPSDKDLVKDLSPLDSEIKVGSIDLEKVKVALEKWCKDASGKDLSEQNIKDYLDKVKSRCTTAPTNIKEKLKRENKSLVTNWSSKFETLKTKTGEDADLETHLKAQDNLITESISSINSQKDKYTNALQKWCETSLGVKVEDNNYETTYTKVISRCV